MKGKDPSIPLALAVTTALIVAVGLAAAARWLFTGEVQWVVLFFSYPGTLLVVLLSAAELFLAAAARWHFSPSDALRPAWSCILLAAACHFNGEVQALFFAEVSEINPAVAQALGPLRLIGIACGGPLRIALLACGLGFVLLAYKRTGLLPRLTLADQALVAVATFFAVRQLYEAWFAFGGRFSAEGAVDWTTDALLSVLVTEAVVIRRAVLNMGRGLVAKCWGAFAFGIFLTSLGDIGVWAVSRGYIPIPMSASLWFLSFVAGAAFALGPAYQVEASRRAAGPSTQRSKLWRPGLLLPHR